MENFIEMFTLLLNNVYSSNIQGDQKIMKIVWFNYVENVC